MKLRMIGCTYHDADLSVRQRIAFDESQIERALRQWQQQLPGTELAILSTCNRVELYAAGTNEPPELDQLISALAGFQCMYSNFCQNSTSSRTTTSRPTPPRTCNCS